MYLGAYATLRMYDNAKINGNTASTSANTSAQGGGVYMTNSTFTMNGGEISGNTATTQRVALGGGVSIRLDSQFIVASEAIKLNIKNNTLSGGGNTNTATVYGAQVYKGGSTEGVIGGQSFGGYSVFTVGNGAGSYVEQDAGTAKGYDSWN